MNWEAIGAIAEGLGALGVFIEGLGELGWEKDPPRLGDEDGALQLLR